MFPSSFNLETVVELEKDVHQEFVQAFVIQLRFLGSKQRGRNPRILLAKL